MIDDEPSGGACLDCHRKYGDEHGFPDMIVPDDVWKIICPGMNGGGLLCPSCICARAHKAGISSRAIFTSGPFEEDARKLIETLEWLWDDANAVGLDGWVGPERGEEPDEYAITVRRNIVIQAYHKIRGTWLL